MECVYLKYTGRKTKEGRVRVNVFLKEVPAEHKDALKSFLTHQKIVVNPIDEGIAKHNSVELSYFDDGFEITYAPARWSFYKMRDYIHTYLRSWDVDLSFASKYLKEFDSENENVETTFSDGFYVELSRKIDQCEDFYYLGDRSIAIFLNGILKILKENLQLYFACAVLQDFNSGKIEYMNYVPETIPRKTIDSDIHSQSNAELLTYPVIFKNEEIAKIHLHLSPHSPSLDIVARFVGYLIAMVDDFIYSYLLFRKEKFNLKKRIADLEKILQESKLNLDPSPLSIGTKNELDKSSTRLILIGSAEHLKESKIFAIFKKAGYEKNKIDVLTEYDKMKSLDMNNLKKMRSKYDGILLGPMPHKMHGDMIGNSLIGMMENHPDDYPPFVVVRDSAGGLKISNSSLARAISTLSEKMERVNQYESVL